MTAKVRKTTQRQDEPLVRRDFQRRGTVEVLSLLSQDPNPRFTDTTNEHPAISKRLVAERLADLRETGMLERTVREGPPLGTSYSLTDFGRRLAKIASELEDAASSDDVPSVAA